MEARYADTVAELKAALKLSGDAKEGPFLDDATYYLLGVAYRETGHASQAVHCFRQSMQIAEQHGRKDTFVRAVIHLAGAYLAVREHRKADQLGIERLLEQQHSLGLNTPTVAALTQVRGAIAADGRFSEAEPLLKRSIELWLAAVGQDHADTALALQNMGIVYARHKRIHQAERLLQQALASWGRIKGGGTLELRSLTSLAEVYLDQDRYGDAAALYERAIRIIDVELRSEHPGLPRALVAYAHVLKRLRRDSEAKHIQARVRRLHSGHQWNDVEGQTVHIDAFRSR